MPEDLNAKEAHLEERLKKITELETEIKKREKAIKEKEKAKKQVLLRLSPSLWDDIAAWAEEDFRSINGQIEYLLTESVRNHKKGRFNVPSFLLCFCRFAVIKTIHLYR